MTVVTRFAPSPTGDLHIGGARTALFAWLFARANGGKFLLRIEDTDAARSTPEAIETILEGINWLGLKSDEPPVMQSQRAERHKEAAELLIEAGAAYRCFVPQTEIDAQRAEAEQAREHLRALKAEAASGSDRNSLQSEIDAAQAEADRLGGAYRSPYRDGGGPTPDAGDNFVVRLRAPDDGQITVDDAVQGSVPVSSREIDDFVLLRSDGSPTYMLAVVVDDHDMGVTHIIRGDDHFRNTFRQIPIIKGLGWDLPTYAHIPLIHGTDGKKLSKRHGAQSVLAFKELGYLPEGVKNYLLRLGWSHGDDEIISEQQAIEWFGLSGLNKAPARLDFDKLNSTNGHYMKQADDDRLATLLLERANMQGISPAARNRVSGGVGALKQRANTLAELEIQCAFLLDIRPVSLSGKQAKPLTEDALTHLNQLSKKLASNEAWDAESLKNGIDVYCEEAGVGIGKVGPALRAVLTGGAPSPDISVVIALLGREEFLARINDFLN